MKCLHRLYLGVNQFVLAFVLFSLLLSSCNLERWEVNTKNVELNQKLKRFDQDLFAINPDSIWSELPGLEEKYPNFLPLYSAKVISIGQMNEIKYADNLRLFLTHPDIQGVKKESDKAFAEYNFMHEIEPGFKRYHVLFPERQIPDIYTHISGFNQSIIVDSGYISIALDKYLGVSSIYYNMLQSPIYKRQNMHPAKIPSDVMQAIALTEFPIDAEANKLVDQMIYHGKVMMFVKTMLPDINDTLIWGFSKEKLSWCEKNERLMWLYLVENKLLFSSEHKTLIRYIEDAPFTSTFSKESPGRSGQYLGYKIVESYLNHHKEISLQQLMENNNYQEILNSSRYKP